MTHRAEEVCFAKRWLSFSHIYLCNLNSVILSALFNPRSSLALIGESVDVEGNSCVTVVESLECFHYRSKRSVHTAHLLLCLHTGLHISTLNSFRIEDEKVKKATKNAFDVE